MIRREAKRAEGVVALAMVAVLSMGVGAVSCFDIDLSSCLRVCANFAEECLEDATECLAGCENDTACALDCGAAQCLLTNQRCVADCSEEVEKQL